MDYRKRIFKYTVMDADLVPGIPLVEIYGQQRVLVENHRGIVGYEDQEILIRVRYGCICVTGQHLKLAKMCRGKLVITGNISAEVKRIERYCSSKLISHAPSQIHR